MNESSLAIDDIGFDGPNAPPVIEDNDPPVDSPFVVVVDTREQMPFDFVGIAADAKQGHAPIAVRTVVGTLKSGDYSIQGFEDRIAVERKSLADLFSTLTSGRARFEREMERLAEMDFAAVVVEASWGDIARGPEHATKVSPRSIAASIIAFQQRFPSVHWVMAGSRTYAAVLTYRTLERFHRDVESGKRTLRSTKPPAAEVDDTVFHHPFCVTFAPLNEKTMPAVTDIRLFLKTLGRNFGLKVERIERDLDDERWIQAMGGIEAVEKCAVLIHERRKAEAKAKRRAKKTEPKGEAAA